MTATAPSRAGPDSSGLRLSTFTVPPVLVRTLRWLLEGVGTYGLALHGYSLEQVLATDHTAAEPSPTHRTSNPTLIGEK
ncbi:hypothetical protein AB4305_25850 [Nocardia sp. 2YAB30]|uniref:hypothetical protein n=1 Tax=unclassified Nocardia TaxID=2637762 RepID=UPI003F9B9C21